MSTSTGLGQIAENIIASYNDRVMSIDELVKETSNMRKSFREEQTKVAADLRVNAAKLKKNLANGEDVRLGDFKNMMTGIDSSINSIQKAVVTLASETQTMMADIQKDHKQMANELKANLANGEDVRLGDFKNMMTGIESSIKTIQERRKELSTEVTGLMKVFGTEREQSAAEWNALIGSIRGGGGKPAVLKKAKVVEKTVKRPEIQAEVVKPKPVPEKAEVPKIKPAPAKTVEPKKTKMVEVQKPQTLEEKILAYVASHPRKGVKVGEMEKPLGLNKLKLGKVSKELLKQGKLRKEDNKYFPK